MLQKVRRTEACNLDVPQSLVTASRLTRRISWARSCSSRIATERHQRLALVATSKLQDCFNCFVSGCGDGIEIRSFDHVISLFSSPKRRFASVPPSSRQKAAFAHHLPWILPMQRRAPFQSCLKHLMTARWEGGIDSDLP